MKAYNTAASTSMAPLTTHNAHIRGVENVLPFPGFCKVSIVRLLREWYDTHKRALPWRTHPDPYRVWLSEIILQQTRVTQGLAYYEKFVATYPTLAELAAAREEEVLLLWQGLGYYSRGRNLLRCAREVMASHHGSFPRSARELQRLPGVGPYTAAAIASICFGERVATVDGNVYRVLARLSGTAADIATPAGKKLFARMAEALVPEKEPGIHNQAMMEFGALHCTPQRPKCATCPLQTFCQAFASGRVSQLPVKARRKPLVERSMPYLIIHHAGGLFLRKRTGDDIWKGLYDFLLLAGDRSGPLHTLLEEHGHLCRPASGVVRHLLTHQRLSISYAELFLQAPLTDKLLPFLQAEKLVWASYHDLYTYPFPRPLRQLVSQAMGQWSTGLPIA